jgi:DNA-binding CsgD family transcriptional regulator
MSEYMLEDCHLNALRDVVVATSFDAPDVAVPWQVLARLRTLLHSDLVMFEGVNDEPGRSYFSQVYAEDVQYFTSSIDPTAREMFWSLVRLSMPNRTWPPANVAEVIASTDTMSVRHWRALPVYVNYPTGSQVSTTFQLLMGIPDGYGRNLRLLCFRYTGRDYNQREHFDLQLLLPHLAAAYRRGHQRRAAQAMTARQVMILELVKDGYTNAQIANRLNLSEGTVRTHLNNIYARLGVQSRTEAVNRVFGNGRRTES